MYKELKKSIKDFTPSEVDKEDICNNFLSHNFIHQGGNLVGEMYEAWAYEYLKAWAFYCKDVNNFIIKGDSANSRKNSGLCYDKNGQIVYLKNGKKVAEYDGLFKYKDKIVFVESSVSELRSYFKNLESSLIRKRDLLAKLFNTDEVYYLVITRPKKRTLVYRSLPHLVLCTIKNPEFSDLEKTDRANETFISEKYIYLDDFISSFSS